MQSEQMAAVLRPREGWDAVDLGFRMVRTFWRPLAVAWLSIVWPLSLLVTLALVNHLFVALFLLWWLKPVYDRVALYVLCLGTSPGWARPSASCRGCSTRACSARCYGGACRSGAPRCCHSGSSRDRDGASAPSVPGC